MAQKLKIALACIGAAIASSAFADVADGRPELLAFPFKETVAAGRMKPRRSVRTSSCPAPSRPR